jgi:porin
VRGRWGGASALRLSAGTAALAFACPGLAQDDRRNVLAADALDLPADRASDLAAIAQPATTLDEVQPTLTSDDTPAKDPFDLDIVVSQFTDIPVAGDADSTLRYGGRVDGFFSYNATSNFKINLRPEYVWGESSNGAVGLIPTNSALFRSEGNGDFDLSASLQYTWDSGATLEVGKMNLFDTSLTIPILESNGHFGFQNLGIVLPPTGIAPNTITGAMLTVPTEKMLYRAWVFDPDSQFGRTGFETAFESGIAVLVAAARRINLGGQPGVVNLAFAGSSRTDLTSIIPSVLTPPPDGDFGDESGEFAVQLSAYQYLATYPEAPGKGWGILARFQASAGDPTFLDYSGYLGVAGNPRFRPQDRFGLAYFHYSLTNELVDDIAFRLDIEDEDGIEAFYTWQFDEGLGLTANLQVVDSAIRVRDRGVVLGGRLTAAF